MRSDGPRVGGVRRGDRRAHSLAQRPVRPQSDAPRVARVAGASERVVRCRGRSAFRADPRPVQERRLRPGELGGIQRPVRDPTRRDGCGGRQAPRSEPRPGVHRPPLADLEGELHGEREMRERPGRLDRLPQRRPGSSGGRRARLRDRRCRRHRIDVCPDRRRPRRSGPGEPLEIDDPVGARSGDRPLRRHRFGFALSAWSHQSTPSRSASATSGSSWIDSPIGRASPASSSCPSTSNRTSPASSPAPPASAMRNEVIHDRA